MHLVHVVVGNCCSRSPLMSGGEAFEEPRVHLGNSALGERQVAVLGREPRVDAGDSLREPHTWPNGTNLSCSPCQCRTGTRMAARSNPQGCMNAKVVVEPAVEARLDAGAHAFEDELGDLPVEHLEVSRAEQRRQHLGELLRRRAAGPSVLLEPRQVRLFTGQDGVHRLHVQLAHSLVEVEPLGIEGCDRREAAAAATRSGSSAAVASACGPPPEIPQRQNRSMPSWSHTATTSVAQSATLRPLFRVEPPYPGRS